VVFGGDSSLILLGIYGESARRGVLLRRETGRRRLKVPLLQRAPVPWLDRTWKRPCRTSRPSSRRARVKAAPRDAWLGLLGMVHLYANDSTPRGERFYSRPDRMEVRETHGLLPGRSLTTAILMCPSD